MDFLYQLLCQFRVFAKVGIINGENYYLAFFEPTSIIVIFLGILFLFFVGFIKQGADQLEKKILKTSAAFLFCFLICFLLFLSINPRIIMSSDAEYQYNKSKKTVSNYLYTNLGFKEANAAFDYIQPINKKDVQVLVEKQNKTTLDYYNLMIAFRFGKPDMPFDAKQSDIYRSIYIEKLSKELNKNDNFVNYIIYADLYNNSVRQNILNYLDKKPKLTCDDLKRIYETIGTSFSKNEKEFYTQFFNKLDNISKEQCVEVYNHISYTRTHTLF